MHSARSPPASVRRHARNISRPERQSATSGPLEAAVDEPAAASPVLPERPKPVLDLRFLQNRDIYHAITTGDIPSVFLNSSLTPPPHASLPHLVQRGHFRRAADASLQAIFHCTPDDADKILGLLYTRLACLILISRPDLAAAEAVPLTDFLARNTAAAQDLIPLIPWHLRLLLVRLQSIGAADGGRRGIMALYALAGEVRCNLRSAQAAPEWSDRLQDLGLRVCDALVEMGELETATRHLDTLTNVEPDELAYRKALLRMRVGDVEGAKRSASGMLDENRKRAFEALLQVADGDYEHAVRSWQSLLTHSPGHEMFALNAAVSLLYTGHITSARDVLEHLAHHLPMFPTLLFNLATVYELCTERAAERKTSLAMQAAAREPGPESGGWEPLGLCLDTTLGDALTRNRNLPSGVSLEVA
ncbi:hypothetical protein AC579_9851 [Pseudocercospora musae]|uniref:Tetratricopeptide repeat protein 15 n=1 Tax=Pseudocercospora musae TaxID=113226 RepID=A0A139I8L1_9PEZI|nr:hypothetical protein AC579_9851 [Pseudocercospora musae]